MKLFLVTGLEGIDKKTIIELAIQRSGRKDKFRSLGFSEIGNLEKDLYGAGNIDMARRVVLHFYSELENVLVADMRKEKDNFVVEGFQTFASGDYGYVNTIPDTFYRVFKPDVLILLEKADPAEGEKEQQEVNRDYATAYAVQTGSVLKVIKVNADKMMEAVGELSRVFKG